MAEKSSKNSKDSHWACRLCDGDTGNEDRVCDECFVGKPHVPICQVMLIAEKMTFSDRAYRGMLAEYGYFPEDVITHSFGGNCDLHYVGESVE